VETVVGAVVGASVVVVDGVDDGCVVAVVVTGADVVDGGSLVVVMTTGLVETLVVSAPSSPPLQPAARTMSETRRAEVRFMG
jgi:hypothetical protein